MESVLFMNPKPLPVLWPAGAGAFRSVYEASAAVGEPSIRLPRTGRMAKTAWRCPPPLTFGVEARVVADLA